ncbi:MauE/DoxX family redox-associated membrane protein [Sphingomicrobium sp. XHP0239]|uniref:MauE/DoxX family redox-associated membrane protein n=1 Tax=Sphingomicrobium maritimum TaxID=3133972 RepID=UPI0031CCD39F
MLDKTTRTARLYRMKMDKHVCPFGLQAKHLLKSKGYTVEDHPLTSRAETDAFKAEHDVDTTPQIFIGDERIGGYEDLRRHLGLKVRDPDAKTYRPVIALFGMAAAMALVIMLGLRVSGTDAGFGGWLELFVPISMCLLALQKLQDVRSFATMFLNYDLLARRWVPYGRIYPWLEGLAGVLMLGQILLPLAIPVALFIGIIGAISVFKAVYIDRRELKCACVGGGNNVPLGFISLTENLMMIGMAIWMALRFV